MRVIFLIPAGDQVREVPAAVDAVPRLGEAIAFHGGEPEGIAKAWLVESVRHVLRVTPGRRMSVSDTLPTTAAVERVEVRLTERA